MVDDSNAFPFGSQWLRADFHLHTRADKEFFYSGDDDYCSAYVDALKKAGIAVGVIANHNKFDFEEFKALRKTARNKQIYLLPGVELSVNDGANGIHTLIVFSDQWLENGQDHINPFLGVAFQGKIPDQYETENGRSSLGLIDTIEKLEGYHKEFFLIFAHVEDRSGLWHELGG
ncbi:MAG: PHP domain-containing protein, partial [Gammaproteobacteria bacterium]|nr:PHP domain-containing protein [Gammaproteobacteria bacterium]